VTEGSIEEAEEYNIGKDNPVLRRIHRAAIVEGWADGGR